jgi:hypothetical protein
MKSNKVFNYFALKFCFGTLLLVCGWWPVAQAAEFALSVSPPRYELKLKPGERSRQVLEITNSSLQATTFGIKTADWTLEADGSPNFFAELLPGSCRPWVALERRELTMSGARPYRFRFEINVPADAKPEQCRFAIMLEGQEQIAETKSGPAIPFSSRLGVVVYVAIGDAIPNFKVVGSGVRLFNGKQLPALQIANSGAAHGRLGGFLTGTDASGVAFEFTPNGVPVLAGETRYVTLVASLKSDSESEQQPKFPMTIRGKIEWGKDQSQEIELPFAQ